MKRLTLCIIFATAMLSAADAQVCEYVDPRIGSEGVGRTFPGPSMPFGMAKPGPDCGVLPNAGWAPMPEPVLGFSQTHVSGTGGGQKYGNILVQPLFFSQSPSAGYAWPAYPQERVVEDIALGYYATTFRSGITTRVTTADRCAFYQFIFPSSASHGLFVDATHFLGKDTVPDLRERQQLVGAELEVMGDRELRGYSRVRGGWNNGDAYTVYFSLHADQPFSARTDGQRAWLQFADTLVGVRVGISSVSALQAARNIGSASFDEQLRAVRAAWERQLSGLQVAGTEAQKRMFYTALYHTMLMPVDKTGENPRWTDAPYYDDYYAIWDTYRTSTPLLTLLFPDRAAAMVNALLNIYRREGYMPDARSGDCNGRTQGGSNADVVIADAFAKRLPGIDYELSLEAMLKNGEADPGADHEKHGRGGLNAYKRLGYVPYGIPRAGTRTVEYAFCDWCIAQVARGLGYDEIAKNYTTRSRNWRHLWRADYESDGMRGFIMPKDEQGRWLDSVPWGNRSPLSSLPSPHVIPYTPTTKVAPWYVPWWDTFFYEATSQEYSLSIPHDVEGLIELCGGAAAFRRRLDRFFQKGYYNVQNEPSFLTPCLYHWIGRPDLSTRRIHQIIRDHYTDRPDGLPGNDDSGAMSSWLCFHMMGLYPLAGTDEYLLNVPLLREYTLTLPGGRQLRVARRGRGDGFRSVSFNGRLLPAARIRHSQLLEGGQLVFSTAPAAAADSPTRGASDVKTAAPAADNPVRKLYGEATPTEDYTISFTLNRQFRTWPFGFGWRGDTLVVRCKETLYMIPRSEVDESDVFCWLDPQTDGTVHRDVRGTFCFVSRRALQQIEADGQFVYEGYTWRRLDEQADVIHVRAEGSRAEMWISRWAAIPLVLRMKNNPLGIDWQLDLPPAALR